MCAHTKTTQAVDASVVVLGSPALWHVVTSFMTGYPRAVCAFVLKHRDAIVATTTTTSQTTLHDPHTSRSSRSDNNTLTTGVLPCLAVAVNDAAMLQTLYELAHQVQYSHDPALSFASVAHSAVVLGRVEMLACLATVTANDANWHWAPSLLRTALRPDAISTTTQSPPSLDVLDWLVAHLPPNAIDLIDATDMRYYSRYGHVAVVEWFILHGCSVPQTAVDDAARCGHAHVLQLLYTQSPLRCSANAIDAAVEHNFVDVVAHIIASQQRIKIGRRAVHAAIQQQSLAMLQLLIEHNIPLDAHHLLDHAAFCGNLAIVAYFNERQQYSATNIGCTTNAMTKAAVNGHIDVVQFLHTHRTEGCCPETLEWAAERGQCAVVAFLLQHRRGEGSVARALRLAARMDRVEIVALLCEHSPRVDVTAALHDASVFGCSRVLELLRAHVNRTQQQQTFVPSDATTRCCEQIASVG